MHCLSASLCFWVWTIIRETLEYISISDKNYDYDEEYIEPYTESYIEPYTESEDVTPDTEYSGSGDEPIALPLTSVSQKEGTKALIQFLVFILSSFNF